MKKETDLNDRQRCLRSAGVSPTEGIHLGDHGQEYPKKHALNLRSYETTMKHYIMSAEEHEKEAIQRSGDMMDSYMDASKKRPSRGRPEYLIKLVELKGIEPSTS